MPFPLTYPNASAQYSIDEGTPVPFQVLGQNSTVQVYNVVSFQSPILKPGPHHLIVKYGVNNSEGSAPLNLDCLIIQNLTIPLITQSPNTTSTQIPTISTIPTIAKHRAGLSEGTIAGVVIGSLGGLALIIFILMWILRFIKGPKRAMALQPVSHKAYAESQYSDKASWYQDNFRVYVK